MGFTIGTNERLLGETGNTDEGLQQCLPNQTAQGLGCFIDLLEYLYKYGKLH